MSNQTLEVTVGRHAERLDDAERRVDRLEGDFRIIREQLTSVSVRVAIYAAIAAAVAAAAGSIIAAVVIFQITGGTR